MGLAQYCHSTGTVLAQYWASIEGSILPRTLPFWHLGNVLECLSPHIRSMWLQGGGFGNPPTLGNWEMSCGFQ